MGEAITTSAKREFIRWFLSNYQLKKNEGTWLFNYFLSDDRLLEKVHFTDDLYNREKTMIISTVCSRATPFLFQKKSKLNYDVEIAFHDIRENPHEDIYINLFFKDRMNCPKFLFVLESRKKMELKQRFSQDHVASLIAEIVVDKAVRRHRLKELVEEINLSLDNNDRELFMKLTEERNQLQRWEKELGD